MSTLGSHSVTLLGSHGSAKLRGGSALSSVIGGESPIARERSPFKSAGAVVGSAISGARDAHIPYEPGRGKYR